jgi:hypothetical protein
MIYAVGAVAGDTPESTLLPAPTGHATWRVTVEYYLGIATGIGLCSVLITSIALRAVWMVIPDIVDQTLRIVRNSNRTH